MVGTFWGHAPDGWNRDVRGRCVDNGHAEVSAPDGGMRAVMDRTLKLTRDGYRWRLCRRGHTPRYRGVARSLYLIEAAVQTHKVLVERHDPAPVRVAPAARSRKRRCDTFVLEGGPPD